MSNSTACSGATQVCGVFACDPYNSTAFASCCSNITITNGLATCPNADDFLINSCYNQVIGNFTTIDKCKIVSHSSGKRKVNVVYWLLLLAASVAMVQAGNVSITQELLNGYTVSFPGLAIPISEVPASAFAKRMIDDQAEIQDSLNNETVYPPNTIYTIPIQPGEVWEGQNDWVRQVEQEHRELYGEDVVYLEKPAWAGSVLKRLNARSKMTRSTSDAYFRDKSVPHGNIWPADFVRSLCYDRCGWSQDCDANNMLVWTTNYISSSNLYKNVQLRGRIYGKINYAWSDEVKWRTRDMLCEAVVKSMNDARIIVTDGKKTGCVGGCSSVQCQRFGCETGKLEMFRGPAGGSLTLAAWWDDGGYSTPGWISWSIDAVQPTGLSGICGPLGFVLSWLAFLPGVGAIFGVAGIGLSAACLKA